MPEQVKDATKLKEEVTPPSQKRKRSGPGSPEARRAKRVAAAAAADMTASPSLGQAYLEDAAAAAAAAAVAVNVDLSALQQANEAANLGDATEAANASSTAAAALGSMFPSMQVPTSTEQQFNESTEAANAHESSPDGSFADVSQVTQPEKTTTTAAAIPTAAPIPAPMAVANGTPQPAQQPQPQPQQSRSDSQFRKPPVGTEEWHKLRKNNHKEVERRRRETINEGINELAKIVPNCEKNKGSILQKAVQFIAQLKANESSNIEKWTLEKLLTEQAIGELTSANDKLKQQYEQLYKKMELYRKACEAHGIEVDTSEFDEEESRPEATS